MNTAELCSTVSVRVSVDNLPASRFLSFGFDIPPCKSRMISAWDRFERAKKTGELSEVRQLKHTSQILPKKTSLLEFQSEFVDWWKFSEVTLQSPLNAPEEKPTAHGVVELWDDRIAS